MRFLLLFLIYSQLALSFDFNPFSLIKNYLNKKEYVLTEDDDNQFKSCQKFQSNTDEYFTQCNEHHELIQNQEIDNLSKESKAISTELLKDHFLDDLKSEVSIEINKKKEESHRLISCLTQNICEDSKNAIISGLRKNLPRMRSLMGQMNMPGKIYSPTRPLRFQENIKHDLGVKVPPLSQKEKDFLKDYTWNLEDDFTELVKREKPQFKDSPMILDSYVTKKFEKQNKRYHQKYQELVSSNPLLTLVNLRGDESDDEILTQAILGLEKVNENLMELESEISHLDADEKAQLIRFRGTTDNYLGELDSEIYCDVANSVHSSEESSEMKRDLLLSGAMIVGGGACSFTFGLGCVLGVAVAGEVYAISVSQQQKDFENQLFLASESNVELVQERNFSRDLTLYLAPVSLLGEGAAKAFKIGYKTLIKESDQLLTLRRIDLDQRKILNDLDDELGSSKSKLINRFNPLNKYNLEPADQIYLAGIVKELQKQKKTPKEISQYLDDLVKECKGGK